MPTGDSYIKTTGYDILHDAVKIGLGAIIGILGTLWVTHLSNQHSLEVLKAEHAFDRESAYIDLRRRKIEQAAAELNEFGTAYADYREAIYKAATESGMDSITKEMMRLIIEKERNFTEAFKRLNNAVGHLKLVDAEASYKSFLVYRKTTEDFFRRCHRKQTDLTASEIDDWRKKINNDVTSLLNALGEDFKNLTP